MGVASLVLGIAGFVVGFFISGIVGIAASIVGIILGAMGRKKGEGSIATAGMVISIISVTLLVLITVVIYAWLGSIFG